jgi:DNA-directed RNA polymerase specialized sigma24 family protein
MDAFLERDAEAADRLYRRVAPPIYRLGSMLLRDEAKAEDLVETTMVQAWRLGASFDPRVISLDAWVRSIARDIVVAVLSEVSTDRAPNDSSGVLRGAIVSDAWARPEHGRATLLAKAQ